MLGANTGYLKSAASDM